MAQLQLQDDEGRPLALDAGGLDFGTVAPGEASVPLRLWIKNMGPGPLHFVRIRGGLHPSEQRGSRAETLGAMEFAPSEHGHYAPELDLGTLLGRDARPVWVRWTVPKSALAGHRVWAMEALAAGILVTAMRGGR